MTENIGNVPSQWDEIDFQAHTGVLMIVGAPDVGKTTFCRYVYQRLCAFPLVIAYLDGDPGQSTLGPPATMTLALSAPADDSFPPQDQLWRSFVGSVSPAGHMLQVLTGAARLVRVAKEKDAQVIIYDTSGLIEPAAGGTSLKLAKIDLLRPTVLFALQRNQELDSLLQPLWRSKRVQVIILPPAPHARQRTIAMRQDHRARQFAEYFANALTLEVYWPQIAILPSLRFTNNCLVALENSDGFTIGLGIIKQVDYQSKKVQILTPVASLNTIDAIRVGDLTLDLETFRDYKLEAP